MELASPARHRGRRMVAGALACLCTVAISGCGSLVEVIPTGNLQFRESAQTSVMRAVDGTVLAQLHAGEDREPVTLDDVPQVVRNAVVAIEDERFFDHAGVDVRAIGRAVLTNARAGAVAQGGSTITQQLAKNTVTGDERTLQRKLEEASIALQLERVYSKDDILEHYLNTVYFGNGAYGVEAAAQQYFGTPVADMSLSQAALVAGLLRSPARYDPYTHPDAALRRRDTVLGKMTQRGMVTRTQTDRALTAPLGVKASADDAPWQAPYFVSHVLEQLQHDSMFAVLGTSAVQRADAIFRGGLTIETTLDPAWQAAAEEAVTTTLDRPEDPQAAAVVIDPSDGGVRALIGGRDWNDPDDPVARFNLATQGHRQPGSTFKEVVLAAALEAGWTLDETIPAPARLVLPARDGEPLWTVANYDDIDYGDVTLREATNKSINTVYAHLIDDLGAQRVVDMAQALGVRSHLEPQRAIALGAQDVTVLDMASVQATLAAGGLYREPSSVTKITAADGTVVYERGSTAGRRVLEEAVAWQLTSALESVIAHGTGERAALRRPAAGKTGTTQDTVDAWFTGYTPDLAAAVWVGFPSGRIPMEPPTTRIRVDGGTWPAEIFARTGVRALQDVPATAFAVPEVALTSVMVDLERDCLPTAFTPVDVVGERAYPRGREPTEPCDDEETTRTADVPDVSGDAWDVARARLEDAGLRGIPQPMFTSGMPPGFAMAQDPSAGRERELDDGYVVRVRVSSGDRLQVVLPTVIGLPVNDAVADLESAGFPVDVETECPDDALTCIGSPGIVYEQIPGDARATIHSLIELQVYPEQ